MSVKSVIDIVLGKGIRVTTLILSIISILPFASAQEDVVSPTSGVSTTDTLRARYGVFGHVALSSHSADFSRMPGTQSCCAGFTGGAGMGLSGGALAELPLAPSITIGARIAILTQSFLMTTSEATRVIVNGVGQDGAFEHRLSGTLTTLGLEPLLGVRLFSSAFVHVGGRIAIPLGSSYEQVDAITRPSGSGTFLNADGTDSRKRTRNEFSGAIPEVSLQISPLVGISYELPLNTDCTIVLVPEVFYQLGVMNVMADSSWKASSFRAGIAIKWSPLPRRDPTPQPKPEIAGMREPELTPPVVRAPLPAKNVIDATIAVSGVDAVGKETPTAKFIVEEYTSTLMTPLLPYLFFDENAHRVPERYSSLTADETKGFDINRLSTSDDLGMYRHLLNIVGSRLRTFPDTKIEITGNNQDLLEEKGNILLSSQRAETIKRYLVDVWGIASRRITTEARSLPSKAATTVTPMGLEENRRAELRSDDARVLAPIVTNDRLLTSNPPILRLRPSASASAGIASWQIATVQDGKVLKVFTGTDSLPVKIDWNLEGEPSTIPRTDSRVQARLTIVDRAGSTGEADAALDVEQITIRRKKQERLGDKVIHRFSLILFDIRSYELGVQHNAALDLIREHIDPTSTVTVIGFADPLGDRRYNEQLARNRSAAVASALRAPNTITKVGSQPESFDGTLPEARLYTRTVNVVIETPVKN